MTLSATCFEGELESLESSEPVSNGRHIEGVFGDDFIVIRVGDYRFELPASLEGSISSGDFELTHRSDTPASEGNWFDEVKIAVDADGVMYLGWHEIRPEPRPETGYWYFDLTTVSCDLRAKQVVYESSTTANDDYLKIEYTPLDLLPGKPTVDLGLYWSVDGTFEGRRQLAYQSRAEEDGKMRVPIKKLSMPTEGVKPTHLVLHVDDIPGGSKEGKLGLIDGDDDSNNYSTLKLETDLVLKSLVWNKINGGLDIEYSVKQRGFVTEKIPVEVYWAANVSAVNMTIKADPAETDAFVTAAAFNPPTMQTSSVTVVFDPWVGGDGRGTIFETNEQSNNQLSLDLPNLAPDVKVRVTGDLSKNGDPQRKKPYSVGLEVTNKAPVPLSIWIDWNEVTRPDLVRDTHSATDRYDALTGRLADRSFRGSPLSPILLPFGHSAVPIAIGALDGQGSFNRTWNWVPTDFRTATQALLEEGGSLADAVFGLADILLVLRGSPLAGIGAELLEVKDAVDALEVFNMPNTLDSASIAYTGVVHVQAKAGADKSQFDTKGELKLVVPPENHSALKALEVHTAHIRLQVHQFPDYAALIASDDVITDDEEAGLTQRSNRIRDLAKTNKESFETAVDPPDPNFTEVIIAADIVNMPPPDSGSGFVGFGSHRSTIMANLDSAVATSYDRAVGAQDAGRTDWQAAQLAAVAELAAASARVFSDIIVHDSLMQARIDGLFSQPITAPRPTDQEVVDLLLNQGLPAELAEIVKDVLAADVDDSLPLETDVTFSRVSSAYAMETAMRTLHDSIQLQIDSVGKVVRPITEAEQAALDDKEARIAALLANRLPTSETGNSIDQFLIEVMNLIVATNDYAALESHLQFGFGSLFSFQQSDFRFSHISEVIKNWGQSNLISDESVVANLQDVLSRTTLHLRDGRYDDVLSGLRSFDSLVNAANASVIPQAEREVLLGYSDLIKRYFANIDVINIPGDFDGDRDVDSADLLSFLENWTGALDANTGGKDRSTGDLDGDRDVDSSDILAFLEAWTGSQNADLQRRLSMAAVVEESDPAMTLQPVAAANQAIFSARRVDEMFERLV
ncbi:MAG: hypothetical protein U0795_00810 [Pirellulales bacterium]